MRLWWLPLARHAHPHRRGLTLVMLLMLVGVGLNTLKPWPLKLIVDYVLEGRPLPDSLLWFIALPGAASPDGLLLWLAGATILLFLTRSVGNAVQGYVQAGVGRRMVYDLGAKLFDHLQRVSPDFRERHQTGDLAGRVTVDSSCVRDLVVNVFLRVVTSLATLITMFVVMWQLDRWLSIVAILVAPALGMIIWLLAKPMTERTYRSHQLGGEVLALTEQTLTSLPAVQAFGREDYEDERFRRLGRRSIEAYLQALLSQLQFRVGTGAVTATGVAVVMVVGGLHVLAGSLSVGSLLVFLSYLLSLYAPLETLAYVTTGYASAAAKARRVFEVLEAEEGVRDAPGARLLPLRRKRERGHVRLERITFGYEPGRPVLEEVTLEARPGEIVALVGPTGAGKSTLVSLIPRFFDPWQGRVTVDGVDVREVQLAGLRAQVALVLQEPFLLPLTVAENIGYGRPGASRAQIMAAAVAAEADEFIRRLPEGYDTLIAERGATLSGGEKQRLAIARALLKDAPILILDEPTSAVDAGTEAAVLAALRRLVECRTTFIIAHRWSTIRDADRIVVLENGRVVRSTFPDARWSDSA